MKKYFSILFIIVLFSCTKDKYSMSVPKPENCDSTRFTFDKDILPILNANCNFTECHAPGGRGAYDYTNYALVVSRIRSGTFEYRIELPLEDPQHMPEKYIISSCDYYQLKTWIAQGYPEK